jgi:hypothetical protein
VRFVHFAHATGSDGSEDLVRTEAGTGGEGQAVVDYTGVAAVRTRFTLIASQEVSVATTFAWHMAGVMEVAPGWESDLILSPLGYLLAMADDPPDALEGERR